MNGDEDPDPDGLERAWQLAELIAGEAIKDSPDWALIAAWAEELAVAARELTPREPQS